MLFEMLTGGVTRSAGILLFVVAVALPMRAAAFSPCVADRDCTSGHCAAGNGICCEDPCDACGDTGACLASCIGDCDDDASVSVAELITATRIALGADAAAKCPPLPDSSIATLTQASQRSLQGCPTTHLLGERCRVQGNCAEGFCRNGYCCEEACDGGRCDFPGFEGLCVPTGPVIED